MTRFIPNPQLENILKSKFSNSLKKSGKVLEFKAKNNAPSDTGALRASIRSDTKRVSSGEVIVETDVDYAEHVEYGTRNMSADPFMRSALKESKNKIMKQFEDIL